MGATIASMYTFVSFPYADIITLINPEFTTLAHITAMARKVQGAGFCVESRRSNCRIYVHKNMHYTHIDTCRNMDSYAGAKSSTVGAPLDFGTLQTSRSRSMSRAICLVSSRLWQAGLSLLEPSSSWWAPARRIAVWLRVQASSGSYKADRTVC